MPWLCLTHGWKSLKLNFVEQSFKRKGPKGNILTLYGPIITEVRSFLIGWNHAKKVSSTVISGTYLICFFSNKSNFQLLMSQYFRGRNLPRILSKFDAKNSILTDSRKFMLAKFFNFLMRCVFLTQTSLAKKLAVMIMMIQTRKILDKSAVHSTFSTLTGDWFMYTYYLTWYTSWKKPSLLPFISLWIQTFC